MSGWDDLIGEYRSTGASMATQGAREVVGVYAERSREYDCLAAGPAIIDRSYRGLLEATGKDRSAWLHNLTTNQVKNLGPGEGNYAFALNTQGRILFDLNILIRSDRIWIDVDSRFLPLARRHLEKYIIMEDVHLRECSGEYVRIALGGERAKDLLHAFGAPHAASMAQLSLTEVSMDKSSIPAMRHDFCGGFGVELFLPADRAVALWKAHTAPTSSGRCTPVGDAAVQARRIEAGIPWPGTEITDEYLPAETRQLERAVSFQKGCYLGQEIVERMRARHVVARLLSGLIIESDRVPPAGAEIVAEGAAAGKVTSSCDSIGLNKPIALGYVKAGLAAPGTRLQVDWTGGSAHAAIAALPFAASK